MLGIGLQSLVKGFFLSGFTAQPVWAVKHLGRKGAVMNEEQTKQAVMEQLAEVPLEVVQALWTIYEYGFQKGQMLKAKAWLDGYDACQDGQPRRYVA